MDGCGQLKQTGGISFVQCQGNRVVYKTPEADIEANLADRFLPLGQACTCDWPTAKSLSSVVDRGKGFRERCRSNRKGFAAGR